MPVYEYQCQDCGQRFDMLRSMRDADEPAICKHCKSNQTRRAISAFFATSDGRSVTQTVSSGGCSGCSGGSCGSCSQ